MVVSKTCLGVSLDLFFPFGYDYSDNKFFSNDDSSVTLVLNGRFVFYDRSYTTVHVSLYYANINRYNGIVIHYES